MTYSFSKWIFSSTLLFFSFPLQANTLPEGAVRIDTLSTPYELYVVNKKVDKASMFMVSAASDEILWKRDYNPRKTKIQMTNHGVLVSEKNTLVLNPETGKKMGKLDIKFRFKDDKDHIYGLATGSDKEIVAYDLATASKLWQSALSNKGGSEWRIICQIQPNILLIESDNVMKLDCENGSVKELKLERDFPNSTKIATATGVVAGGLLGGAIGGLLVGSLMSGTSVPTSIPAVLAGSYIFAPKLNGFGSSVISDNSGEVYFVADRDNIICFDSDLNERWRTHLPKGSGAHSKLYLRGDTIDILNTGTFYTEKKPIKCGKPFFASYSAHDGKEINMTTLSGKWPQNVYGDYLDFIEEEIYLLDSSTGTYEFVPHDPSRYPIRIHDDKVVFIDNEYNFNKIYNSDEIYVKLAETEDKLILSHIVDGKSVTVELKK